MCQSFPVLRAPSVSFVVVVVVVVAMVRIRFSRLYGAPSAVSSPVLAFVVVVRIAVAAVESHNSASAFPSALDDALSDGCHRRLGSWRASATTTDSSLSLCLWTAVGQCVSF